jgi:hypothetical protein
MDDPTANRAAMALLLLLTAWAVIFLWFNPIGWSSAAVLVVAAFLVAPRLP